MKHADSVFEKIDLSGKWWLPEVPNHEVDGRLVGSDAEGFRLTISGSFNPEESVKTYLTGNGANSFPVIHGRTRDGIVTLLDSFWTKRSGTFSELFEYEFYANTVIKGSLLRSPDDLHFQTLQCKFSVLCDWIDTRAFDYDPENGLRQSTIKLTLPARMTVYQGNGMAIHIDHAVRGPEMRIGQNSLTVEWEPQFVVEGIEQELPWEHPTQLNHSSTIHALSQFLAVATLNPVYPFDIAGYSGQFERAISKGKTYKVPIELRRKRRVESPNYDIRSQLFSWHCIAQAPQEYFGNWFRIFRGLHSTIALFVDSVTRRHSYSPERFFNLMIALEGLHRFKYPEASRPTPEHTQRVQGIIKSVPDNCRNWLDETLAFSYEPSLRRRLKDLTKPFADLFGWLIGATGSPGQQKEWCNKITGAMADARNCIAHNLPETWADPGQRYYHFTRIAETLIAIWLMKEIGLEDQTIDDRIRKSTLTIQYRADLLEFLKAGL
ncbi:MAG: HEPN domain-containing protein [Phycisphaerae bacterium]|jgi:hypothetical protein